MMCQPGRSYEREVAEIATYNMSLVRDDPERNVSKAASIAAGAAAKKPRYPYASPELKFWKMWLIHFMLPIAVVVWIETKSIWYALGSSLIPFFLSMSQGALGILRFRLFFGAQPYPELPAHGVVSVNPEEKSKSKSTSPSLFPSPLLSPSNGASLNSTTSPTSPITKEVLDQRIMDIHYQDHNATTTTSSKEPPLRLLVLGDSLAIGVGQSRTPTPIMPEVIAKTLSKAMGGRVVYWTCQGAPGASSGALAKIIEEGVNHTYRGNAADGAKTFTNAANKASFRSAKTNIEDEDYEVYSDMEYDDNHDEQAGQQHQRGEEKWSNLSDTSDTSDETEFKASVLSWNSRSHVDGEQEEQHQQSTKPRVVTNEDKRRSMKIWRERLRQHKKRFDPDLLGPYDIVVVFSGSNDIKAACFPYLLRGSDSVLWKEVISRGGTYADELMRVSNAIRNKMNSLRESVTNHWKDSTFEENAREPSKEDRNSPPAQKELSCNTSEQTRSNSIEPLIVLPGISARTSPIFWLYPFRWLAIPTVDIMEGNKKRLERRYPDEFLYVAPPTPKDVKDYEEGRGSMWEHRCEEDTILSLHETKKSTRRRIEEKMKLFYTRQGRIPESQVDPMKSGYRLYSADNIHPNDDGIDMWARHIANSIVQKWIEKNNIKDKQI